MPLMPHRRVHATGSLIILSLFALLLAPAAAPAQVRFAPQATIDPLGGLLEAGRTLELQKRWGEALSHYEDALREHPGQPSLEERLNLAKIHYDLSRRYSDQSFRQSLATLPPERALDLYSEVLLKINAHYVGLPDWRQIVGRGTTCLDVALTDRTFRESNLAAADDARLEAFRREMYQHSGQQSIQSRHDARSAVAAISQLAGQRLAMSPTVVVLEYTCAALGGLDDYSSFLTGDQLRDIYSQIEGNFVGLGIELKAADGSLLLVNVIPDSPAMRAGIKAGDRIVAVGEKATSDLTSDQAAALLQGPEGTTVDVTVLTPGAQPRRLRVRREHVEVPSVEQTRIADPDFGIGYLKLTSFQKTTTRDLDAALWQLHRLGMRSLIIDLRGNPGGLLTTAVEMADRFIEQGIIVSTRGRSPQEDYDYSAHRPGTWRVPLVVLIDGDSASASEIFAGAIRDSRRGTVVGTRSYGKGSVQGIFPLHHSGAGVRLTTAKFYSPSGRPISKVGVQPDIVVRQAAKATERGIEVQQQDAILEAGLGAARRQVASR